MGNRLTEMMKANRADSIVRRMQPTGGEMPTASTRYAGLANMEGASMIPVEKIIADPDQPRKEFDPDALRRLEDSLKARGQLQPIRVRWSATNATYVVVMGERRWRAALNAGFKSIGCVIVEGDVTPEERLIDQLTENLLREDLKPVEQARAYKSLKDANGWSLRQLAEALNVHFTTVQKALDLLGLPEAIQERIDGGDLSASTAQAIAANIEDPLTQIAIAGEIMGQGLNRQEAREVVERYSQGKPKPKAGAGGIKGKASKAKPVGPPTKPEWIVRTPDNRKVAVTGRKPFTEAEALATLEAAVETLRARMGQGVQAAPEAADEQAA